MRVEESKIPGVGIVPLRCECCYGSIQPGDGVVALLKDGAMRFLHNSCYDENDAETIVKKMDEMSVKTKNDCEMASIMDESND